MSVKQVVILFYGLAAVAGGIGVTAAIYLRGRYAVILYAVLLAIIWVIFWKLGMITPHRHGSVSGEPGGAAQSTGP